MGFTSTAKKSRNLRVSQSLFKTDHYLKIKHYVIISVTLKDESLAAFGFIKSLCYICVLTKLWVSSVSSALRNDQRAINPDTQIRKLLILHTMRLQCRQCLQFILVEMAKISHCTRIMLILYIINFVLFFSFIRWSVFFFSFVFFLHSFFFIKFGFSHMRTSF